MPVIRVRFMRFWKGFDPRENFLTHLIENLGFEVKVIENKAEICDIEFVSVNASNKELIFQILPIVKNRLFGTFRDVEEKYKLLNVPKTANAIRRIWVTGENVRPPFTDDFDGYLSFDQNLLQNNAYLPIWYFDAGFYKTHFVSRVGVETSVESLLKSRGISKVPPKFACIFVGNPHAIRLHFLEILQRIASVEKFGAAFGNHVKHKFAVGREFKFTIAFENDLYPGYVTEKLLEAYLCESIPVYWGHLGLSSPINLDAIMVIKENQSLEDLAQELSELSEAEILEKLNQPFLKFKPQTQDIARVIFGNSENGN